MEPAAGDGFADRDRRAATQFAAAARRAGVARIIYLGGLHGDGRPLSEHLRSRAEVERILLDAAPAGIALRSSIVIGGRSRSFRALAALVERLPVLVLGPWHRLRTAPIDERDAVAYLVAAADAPPTCAGAFDIGGPETLSYGELLERIADCMLLTRPALHVPFAATELVSAAVARLTGEPRQLIEPLMGSLTGDLLPDDEPARAAFGVALHSLDAALDHALAERERGLAAPAR